MLFFTKFNEHMTAMIVLKQKNSQVQFPYNLTKR